MAICPEILKNPPLEESKVGPDRPSRIDVIILSGSRKSNGLDPSGQTCQFCVSGSLRYVESFVLTIPADTGMLPKRRLLSRDIPLPRLTDPNALTKVNDWSI